MKAILLAAGVGSRIAEDIGMVPKSTLEVEGKPLILHTVELLQKNHIEVVIITGFKHRIIEEIIKDYNVRIYYNPFYRVTNSIGSLWYARDEFYNTNEILIANADVYYNQEMLDKIFSSEYDQFLLEDKSRAGSGDYFFYSPDGILRNYGKELRPDERDSEYVGIGVLRKKWIQKFRDRLCSMIEKGEYNLWWENVLYSMVDTDEIHTVDVDNIFWAELDTIEDYKKVQDYCRYLKEKE
ncbi:MAG: phosphocholine cytidylyltransferase family protein [Eubacterium sp.]|nr:phosphocholine cytidylyltransferase family protein [Eubacterium sp.]